MLYSSAYEKKEILKKDYYGNGTVGKFEEIQVCMSSDYDKILTHFFGKVKIMACQKRLDGLNIC